MGISPGKKSNFGDDDLQLNDANSTGDGAVSNSAGGGGADAGLGLPPVANNDDVTVTENTTINGGSVFSDNGHGPDSDPEMDPFVVTAVNGNAASVGNQITLASGAHLTLNADGTFNYDPNHAFDNLPDFVNSG